MATSELLEAMRALGVTRMGFVSSGSVYGETGVVPTPEDAPLPLQTSLYGATKLAGEGMLQAYCHGFGFTGVVFRFVSILGERYRHGHVIDFWRALRRDPTRLRVLGDGRQEKSYLYVGDCVQGMLTALAAHTAPGDTAVYNLGTDGTVLVDDSAALIAARLGVAPAIEHTGGRRGWPGDAPRILLDCTKLRALGWAPALTIEQAIAGRWTGWRPHLETDEHHLHPRPAADLARRRRHRPAVVLPTGTRASSSPARSTSTSTCSSTRPSSATTA